MILVNFPEGDNKAKVYGLYQWDYGQQLRIQGLDLPTAVEIHFSLQDIGGESVTRIGTTADGVTNVVIPDSMLENEEELGEQYSVFAYVYLSDQKSGETIKKIEMIVSTRPKPEAWDKPGDEELFHQAIEAVNSAADRAETAEGNAAESAESAKEDAAKTAEDRKKVEELVEMTSGIDEQVKEYKDQAQTAATNAALSEQAAKTAQEAAQTAQTAAESAEDAAEQHALEAAGDKAEVQRIAGQVATDKQTVAQDKAEVEKKVSDFNITAQQAIEDVNNDGQAQTERVQGTGDTAVQNVNTAKDAAVQEVNSTKDAAVQAVNTAGQEQVATVQEEGQKVIDSIPEDYQTAMAGKVDKQQGKENAGRVLGIDKDGNVVPVEQSSGGIDFEKISNLLIKPQTEQAELLKINDSADFPVLELSGQGWTEQNTTTGAQLFDKTKITEVKPGTACTAELTESGAVKIQATVEKSGPYAVIKAPIALQANKTYYATFRTVFASTGRTPRLAFFKKDQLGGFLSYDKYTPTENIEIELGLYMIDPGQIGDSVEIDNIMISETENADYEPYTGNKPSPSPDYPQEILNAGKYNEETQRYEYVIQMAGKNLFNFPDIESASGTVGRKCNITNNIVISARADNLEIQSDVWRFRATFKDGSFAYVTDGQIKNGIGIISVSGENPIMEIQSRSIYIISGAYRDIQVEYGDKATEYEPYREPKSVKITSDRPVSHLDRLEQRDGVYGWVYKSNYIEDLAAEIPDNTQIYGTDTPYFSYELKNTDLNYDKTKIITEVGVGNEKYQPKANTKSILIYINQGDTIQTAKEHLHYKVIYETTEKEEWIPLSQEEQQALKEICTYYPATTISTDTGMLMQVKYVADTKTYIGNNYEPKTELESIKERIDALERAEIN